MNLVKLISIFYDIINIFWYYAEIFTSHLVIMENFNPKVSLRKYKYENAKKNATILSPQPLYKR